MTNYLWIGAVQVLGLWIGAVQPAPAAAGAAFNAAWARNTNVAQGVR